MEKVTKAAAVEWILLARLLRPQGRKGELLAELLTDFPERFTKRSRVYLAAEGFAGPAEEARVAEILGFWLPVGKNEGRIVLQFAGTDSIDQAEKLAGLEVIVPASERLPLEAGATYVSDLVGCLVFNGANEVGVVEGVQFPTTSDGSRRQIEAAPLLTVLGSDRREILIPFANDFITKIDLEARQIRMTLPDGLLDING